MQRPEQTASKRWRAETTTEWIMLDDFFQIVLPLCASFSIFMLQFSFHKGMHDKFHKMLQKMFRCVFSPLRICMNNIVFPKLGWPQLCKWIMTCIYISTMNEWMDSIKVNCTSGIGIVFKTNFCDVMWCCLAAASGKQSSSAGCNNGSTILAIRTDKVTHEWINDYKMPTSPPAETSQADVNVLFQNIVQKKQIEIARKGLWM